jgi:hypothetical protein
MRMSTTYIPFYPISWSFKVCRPQSNIDLVHASIFERCMTRLVVKNEHQIETCDNEIGLCAQNRIINVLSIVNTLTRSVQYVSA